MHVDLQMCPTADIKEKSAIKHNIAKNPEKISVYKVVSYKDLPYIILIYIDLCKLEIFREIGAMYGPLLAILFHVCRDASGSLCGMLLTSHSKLAVHGYFCVLHNSVVYLEFHISLLPISK